MKYLQLDSGNLTSYNKELVGPARTDWNWATYHMVDGLSRGERRGTPWAGYQPAVGLTQR